MFGQIKLGDGACYLGFWSGVKWLPRAAGARQRIFKLRTKYPPQKWVLGGVAIILDIVKVGPGPKSVLKRFET